PCRSVRAGGQEPEFVAIEDGALAAEAGRIATELAGAYGTVGLVVPPDLRSGLGPVPPEVTVLDPPDAKGLEFDAVVVVEPAAIAGGDARGLRLLYVALTRAVQELVVVHSLPLPGALAGAAAAPSRPAA
ncbi:MAG TPA: ATP-binding domain-containing protein, partial [Acidimicrobiales bacterium]